jgi:ferredoxin-thioredoxin reductase catalytic subunit
MSGKTTPEQIEQMVQLLEQGAADAGYNLNPDAEFTRELAESLLINADRYGYQSCPCRLASGERAKDLDIICPCDYRDPDLNEFGACYCALYVSDAIATGEKDAEPIPERRPAVRPEGESGGEGENNLSHPVWRCKVCGYLCARDEPPGKCPICKADKDRFEQFL